MSKLKEVLSKNVSRNVSRRLFLGGIGAGLGAVAAGSVLAGCGDSNHQSNLPNGAGITDADILNFALNLEYLEAEFYLRAATGQGLSAADIGANPGAVVGGSQVAFMTPAFKAYALEIANDELAHVRFLRKALGTAAVDRPTIDLTNSFNAAANAAGIGTSFNAFANEQNFLVGAFTFEDVGVTAYHGAATLIKDKTILTAAAGILGTEAYHAGEIRTILSALGGTPLAAANKISALRAAAGGGNETPLDGTHIVAADTNSIAFDRTTDQVLHIVYLSAMGMPKSGGFFPNGLNGKITAAAS